MSALVAGYANPTRPFDEAAANEFQAVIEAKVRNLFDLDTLTTLVDAALAALAADGKPAPLLPLELDGEGFVRIERICRGHGTPAPPVDKQTNGALALTAGYGNGALDPVVFGSATACREQLGETRIEIAGDVHLFVGDQLKLTEIGSRPMLFELANFALAVDDVQVLSGGFDFQLCRGNDGSCVADSFELLVGLDRGASLIFFINLATKSGGFRAANGVWTCDFAAATCSDGAGGVVTTPPYQL